MKYIVLLTLLSSCTWFFPIINNDIKDSVIFEEQEVPKTPLSRTTYGPIKLISLVY